MNHIENTEISSNGNKTKTVWGGYAHWITLISCLTNRLYYRDQSPATLNALEAFARECAPTVIVELGTLSGMSCRTWLRAVPGVRIVCVDLNFRPLHESATILPLDFSRLTLVQKNILEVDFPKYWGPEDKVLFFVDAHDMSDVPIMRHICRNAIPFLPRGSIVVVDDIWYSRERLTPDTAPAFLRDVVVPEIDSLMCFDGHYAPYHAGGSFMGFPEVIPLLEYVNARKISLHFDHATKNISFHVPYQNTSPDFSSEEFATYCGVVQYNPLMPAGDTDAVHADMRRIAALYASAGPAQTEQVLMDMGERGKKFLGMAYALAVCRARQGDLAGALRLLETPDALASAGADTLYSDLKGFLHPMHTDDRQRRPGVTLFAVPKAFTGHTGRIQRNAIESWTRLEPRPDIILFGDEAGVAETAEQLGVRYVPELARNDFGTPLLDEVFKTAQEMSETDLIAYVNADIILFNDFLRACDATKAALAEFLMIGQRQDYTVLCDIDFCRPDWDAHLRADAKTCGIRHAETGIDYFVFTPGLYQKIPPFAIGRTCFDNWLLQAVHGQGKPVVDATDAVFAIHQTHGYGHAVDGWAGAWSGIEARRNRLLAGSLDANSSTSGATYAVDAAGTVVPRRPRPAAYASVNARLQRMQWLVRQAQTMIPAVPEIAVDILHDVSKILSELAGHPEKNKGEFSAELCDGHFVRISQECLSEIGVNVWSGGSLRDAEKAVLKVAQERIRALKGPVVFDIGANTGLVSLLPSVRDDLMVFAFEPNPLVFDVLRKNLTLNKLADNVSCFPLALTSYDGTEVLKIPKGHTGLSCLGKPRRFQEWHEIVVPTATLDTFVVKHDIQQLDLLKIDTEGCELFVLQGGRKAIEKFKPDLLLESYEDNTRQFDYSVDELRRYIEDMGYNFIMVTEEDALCIHRSKR